MQKEIKCTECTRIFRGKVDYQQHRAATHGAVKGRQERKCSFCSRIFKSDVSYKQHLDASHPRKKSPDLKLQTATVNPPARLPAAIPRGQSPANNQAVKLVCKICGKGAFKKDEDRLLHELMSHAVAAVADNDEMRTKIELEFRLSWLERNLRPEKVEQILRVNTAVKSTAAFEQYRKSVEAEGISGSDVRVYHGTTLTCDLGINGNSTVCNRISCNLCNIIKSGFKTKKANRQSFLRFGYGIYTTMTPSKAHHYSRGSEGGLGAGRRALLLCRVIVGKAFYTTKNMPELTRPPEGYHSVVGTPGENLQFGEVVVYDPRAIVLEFIIIYTYR